MVIRIGTHIIIIISITIGGRNVVDDMGSKEVVTSQIMMMMMTVVTMIMIWL